MQFTILVNQSRALEWGLNAQQAMLFAFLFSTPTWANATELNGIAYCYVSKSKVCEEMPLITDKPNTVYRLMKQLEALDLIRMACIDNQTHIAITAKGSRWNGAERTPESVAEKLKERGLKEVPRKKIQGSDKNPHLGEISAQGSDKNPNNQSTSNQVIKKTNKKRSIQKTLRGWLEDIRQSGEISIPPDDPIFDYASDAGLPIEFIRMAWVEFKARYLHNDKKYTDWRATFRNSVRGDWFKLWRHDGQGYVLTPLGLQANAAMTSEDKRSAA